MGFLIVEVAIQKYYWRIQKENEVMYLSSGSTALKVFQINSLMIS